MQENILPLLDELRKHIPVAIPTLYDVKLLEAMRLPEFIDAGDIQLTDNYFDSFYYQLSDSMLLIVYLIIFVAPSGLYLGSKQFGMFSSVDLLILHFSKQTSYRL